MATVKKKNLFQKIFRRRKIYLFLFVIFSAVLIFSPLGVNAQDVQATDSADGSWIFTVIGYIFYFIWYLTNWMMVQGGKVLSYFINNPGFDYNIVNQGWRITRDVANMGFILALLATAFSTILNVGPLRNYHVKAILPKIVIVALLLNFSLFFVKIVGGSGDILMKGMLVVKGNADVAGNLELLSRIVEVIGADTFDNIGGFWIDPTQLNTLLAMVIITILSIGLAFSFIAVAGMLLIRTVILMFVAVFAPLAMVSYLFPVTQKYFNMWLNWLLKYAYMGPILLFMILLTITLSIGFIQDLVYNPPVKDGTWAPHTNALVGTAFIIASMFLSTMIAQKLSFVGGQQLFGAARSATRKVITGLPTGAAGAAGKGGKWAYDRTIGRNARATEWVNNRLNWGTKIPLVGKQVANLQAGLAGRRQKGMDEEIARMESYGDNLAGMKFLTAREKAAQFAVLSKAGKFDDLAKKEPKYAKQLGLALRQYNVGGKDAYAKNAHLAGAGIKDRAKKIQSITDTLKRQGVSGLAGQSNAAWKNTEFLEAAINAFGAGAVANASKEKDGAREGYSKLISGIYSNNNRVANPTTDAQKKLNKLIDSVNLTAAQKTGGIDNLTKEQFDEFRRKSSAKDWAEVSLEKLKGAQNKGNINIRRKDGNMMNDTDAYINIMPTGAVNHIKDDALVNKIRGELNKYADKTVKKDTPNYEAHRIRAYQSMNYGVR